MIELLVVIAIISVPAAILFPAFAVAREKARQIEGQADRRPGRSKARQIEGQADRRPGRSPASSNLKQIGLGLLQYTQDYDELMPQAGGPRQFADGTQYMPWQTFIAP